MARLERTPFRWGILLAVLMTIVGTLIFVDVLSPGEIDIGWVAITGLVTIPVLLRVVRGSVSNAEAVLLDRVRAHLGQRSRFYGRQITKSLNRDDPILEEGERVIVELHRHPLAMISPSLIAMVAISILRGLAVALYASLRVAFSSIWGAITFLIGAALIALTGWYIWTVRFWALGIVLSVLVIALSVYVRLWRVQTVIVTDRNIIRFHGLRAKPSRIPRSGPYELRLAKRSAGSRILAWLRIISVPWDTIEVIQVDQGANQFMEGSCLTGRVIGEAKGLIGAKVALEHVAFALEWKPRAELEPPEKS